MAIAITRQDEFDFCLRRDLVGFTEFMLEVIAPNAFQSFVPNWHHRAVGNALMRVWSGECRRLIILAPPRSLKSIMTSVVFPAWCLGHDPARKFLCASR